MPGFSAETCSVRPGMQIRCGGFTHRGAFSEWEGIEACPGVASVPPTPRRRSRNTAWRRAYIRSDAPGLRLEYGMSCLHCAGPALSGFTFTLAGEAAATD